jgi:REP element-mobilizing transposase RayT
MMARPHRLAPAAYLGPGRYFLTICCHRRRAHFGSPAVAANTVSELLRTATEQGVAIHAYCVMPDHLHALCEATTHDASLPAFVSRFKQRSAHRFACEVGGRLWQESFFDRHLRAGDDLRRIAAYIVANPVRAGLVANAADYPFCGSATMTLDELLGSIAGPGG